MKKVLYPSMDVLYDMQDKGVDMYKYLLVKAIESLIVDYVNYPRKGSILLSQYKYLLENEDIVHTICMMYPEEKKYSEVARNDLRLYLKCLSDLENKNNIDDSAIIGFDDVTLRCNSAIQGTVIALNNILRNNPKYRFEYSENKLFEDIFSGRIKLDSFGDNYSIDRVLNSLIEIDPSYLSYLNSYCHGEYKEWINRYFERYDIDSNAGKEYRKKDILTNPDNEIKQLIKCITKDKDNLYKTMIRK